jgi:hypothetical protein
MGRRRGAIALAGTMAGAGAVIALAPRVRAAPPSRFVLVGFGIIRSDWDVQLSYVARILNTLPFGPDRIWAEVELLPGKTLEQLMSTWRSSLCWKGWWVCGYARVPADLDLAALRDYVSSRKPEWLPRTFRPKSGETLVEAGGVSTAEDLGLLKQIVEEFVASVYSYQPPYPPVYVDSNPAIFPF